MTSSPANRTALRAEENRPAPPSQQVSASAVTGPTPYSRCRQDLRAGQVPGRVQQPCRTASRRASSAASMSRAVATCSCPAGDSCAAASARSSGHALARCAARPRPAAARPGGTAPRGCAATQAVCSRRRSWYSLQQRPALQDVRRRDPALRQPALGQQLPQVPGVGLVGLGVPLAAARRTRCRPARPTCARDPGRRPAPRRHTATRCTPPARTRRRAPPANRASQARRCSRSAGAIWPRCTSPVDGVEIVEGDLLPVYLQPSRLCP